MSDRYVFDLDNTLIMTDELNNISYNYALAQFGLHTIETSTRITRSTVLANYPNLADSQREKIIELKQRYFIENINLTSLNMRLTKILQSKEAAHCILWTNADKKRVDALLRLYDLEKYFANIVYSEKLMLGHDINEICEYFDCAPASLLFFEDDAKIIEELKALGQKVFASNLPDLL